MKTSKTDFYDHPCCVKYVESIEEYMEQNGRPIVLDLGCGDGRDLIFLSKNELLLFGIGVDDHHTPEIYKEFQKSRNNLIFLRDDILHTLKSFSDGVFDMVCYNNSFEHLEYPEDAFRESVRVMKRFGRIFITLPFEKNHNDPDHKCWFNCETLTAMAEKYVEVLKCEQIDGGNMYLLGRK